MTDEIGETVVVVLWGCPLVFPKWIVDKLGEQGILGEQDIADAIRDAILAGGARTLARDEGLDRPAEGE